MVLLQPLFHSILRSRLKHATLLVMAVQFLAATQIDSHVTLGTLGISALVSQHVLMASTTLIRSALHVTRTVRRALDRLRMNA